MREIFKTVAVAVGLMAIGAAIGVLVVLMLDPACGPDGKSQRECGAELIDTLIGADR